MAQIFISYSRVDSQFVEKLYPRLGRKYNYENVWYDDHLHGGDDWWRTILDRVAWCDVFIYLLSNESVRSEYCQAEFMEARRLRKHIITIQVRDRTKLSAELSSIQYIDMKPGVDQVDAIIRLFTAIDRVDINAVRKARPRWKTETPKPGSLVDAEPSAAEVDTPTLAAPRPPAEGKTASGGWLTEPFAIIAAAVITGLFAVLAAFIALSGGSNETPDVDATITPTLRPVDVALERARSFNGGNDDWSPFSAVFDDVEMVLVPAGCFDMGSEDGNSDEQPIHEVCFDEPFWIDKYEVTNDQYGSVGCSDWSSEPDQPRNCVTWFEASDHCEARNTRLPTEAEWEYAARGPDALVYPWGNEWNPDNANWSDTSPDGTFTVDSFPQGASWVGALDMSGNLWEWTSSLREDYPYDETDGREDLANRSPVRVVRGGSFINGQNALRAAFRNVGNTYDDGSGVGFRCVRAPSL